MPGKKSAGSQHLVELSCPCCRLPVRILSSEVRLQATFVCPCCGQETRFESAHLLETLHQIEAILAENRIR